MEEPTKQSGSMPPKAMRKACQITLMFPVADDAYALVIKNALDVVVKDIKEKRYNFSINEL